MISEVTYLIERLENQLKSSQFCLEVSVSKADLKQIIDLLKTLEEKEGE